MKDDDNVDFDSWFLYESISVMKQMSDLSICIVDTGVIAAETGTLSIRAGTNFSGEGAYWDWRDLGGGHGTTMARTVQATTDGANLVIVKVLDQHGCLPDSHRLTLAFEWIVHHERELGIGVVCTALADFSQLQSDDDYRDTQLQRLIADLARRNIACVFPTGNNYRLFEHTMPHGMGWPAIIRETVSVGALITEMSGALRLHPKSQRLPKSDQCLPERVHPAIRVERPLS